MASKHRCGARKSSFVFSAGLLFAGFGCTSEDSGGAPETASSNNSSNSTGSSTAPTGVASNSTGSSDTNSTEQTSTIASNGSAATTTVDDTEVANSSDNMTVNGSMPSNETSGSTDGQSTSGSKSDVQHCLHEAGCLEFRGHRAVCQLTNEQNCESLFQGEYGQGPCPADLFDEQKSTNTSCGLTITFS
jgi:hypothetical protein